MSHRCTPSKDAKYFLIGILPSVSEMLPLDEGLAEDPEPGEFNEAVNVECAREPNVPVDIVLIFG